MCGYFFGPGINDALWQKYSGETIQSTIVALCNNGNLVFKTLKKGGSIGDWEVRWQSEPNEGTC